MNKKTVVLIIAAGVAAAFLFYKLKKSGTVAGGASAGIGSSVPDAGGVAPLA